MPVNQVNAKECDVLVIGGGMAGCWAALRASDFSKKVVLVDKGKVSRSGMSPFCGGFILCPDPQDDMDVWHKEIAAMGEYVNDQDWVRTLLQDLPGIMEQMNSWGPVFERDSRGNYRRFKGRGHDSTRIVIFDSRFTLETMRRKLEEKGVEIHDRTMIVDLLTADGVHPTSGKISGALALNTRTAETTVYKARSVIISSGGSGFGDDLSGLSGDGVGMAFRAGVEVTGMEFSRWWANWTFNKIYRVGHVNQWQALNWRLYNSKNERFMLKDFPELKERGREQDLTSSIGKEYVEGHGPVYADFRHVDPEGFKWARSNPAMAHIVSVLDRVGIKLETERVRYDQCPGFIFFQGSGIRNNIYTETNLSGLYAAGQAGGYPTHGTYSVGGVNIATCVVSGYRAGEYAAKLARENAEPVINQDQVSSLRNLALKPLRRKTGTRPNTLRERMGEYMSVATRAFYRDDAHLKENLAEVENWREILGEIRAEDPHDLIKANSVKNFILCWELAFLASLKRTETRGACLRTDYPYTDNSEWLKRIVAKTAGKKVDMSIVPVPIYRYPAKPANMGKIPFPFDMPVIK